MVCLCHAMSSQFQPHSAQPLASSPIFHERSFRQDWRRGEDLDAQPSKAIPFTPFHILKNMLTMP